MKRITLILLMGVLTIGGLNAAQLQVGLLGGLRTVADSKMADVYGSGLSLTPFAAVEVCKGFSLGAGWSFGYSKEKPIGILSDPSKFSMSTVEIFGRYRFEAGTIDPYVKAGLGLTFYSQTVAAAGVDFSKSAVGVTIAGGAEWAVSGPISVIGEVGYTVLSVNPLGTKINLGGFRFQVGAAFAFTL
jgi:opacity protein-like surface antigen